MNLASFKSYIESHAATLEESVAAEFHKFHDWVVNEEGKIAAEIDDLTGRGYTVIPPQPDVPQAPSGS